MMPGPPLRRDRSLMLLAVALPALLIALAVLQYRWVGELSDAQLDRLRAAARARAAQLGSRLDREVTRAFLWLAPEPDRIDKPCEALLERALRWRERAPHPSLVKSIYYTTSSEQPLLKVDVEREACSSVDCGVSKMPHE